MNHEPRPEKQKSFWIELGGKRLTCTPENTNAYLYEDQTFDHIFYTTKVDDDGNRNGYYIFRPMLGDETFDNLVRHMINNDFDVESLTEPDDNDKQVYISKYGEPKEPPKLLEPIELTPRQDKYCTNHGKFLQFMDIDITDFL